MFIEEYKKCSLFLCIGLIYFILHCICSIFWGPSLVFVRQVLHLRIGSFIWWISSRHVMSLSEEAFSGIVIIYVWTVSFLDWFIVFSYLFFKLEYRIFFHVKKWVITIFWLLKWHVHTKFSCRLKYFWVCIAASYFLRSNHVIGDIWTQMGRTTKILSNNQFTSNWQCCH